MGGDYYDFLPYVDGRWGFCIADVCGKGLPAALMMTSLQARVQMLAETAPDPGLALTALNRSLVPRFPLGKFITCFYGVLNMETGHFVYANAGHNYPLVLRHDAEIEKVLGGDLVLGLESGIEYATHELTLQSGDTLLLYSDGVTEAPSPQGEHFGERRLADFLLTSKGAACRGWIDQLVHGVRAWCARTSFPDDFTVVLLRRL